MLTKLTGFSPETSLSYSALLNRNNNNNNNNNNDNNNNNNNNKETKVKNRRPFVFFIISTEIA